MKSGLWLRDAECGVNNPFSKSFLAMLAATLKILSLATLL